MLTPSNSPSPGHPPSMIMGTLNPATINVNSDPLTSFNNPPEPGNDFGLSGTTRNAVTMLHELGHALNFMFGEGTSQIKTDGPSVPGGMLLSKLNTLGVYANCVF